MKNKSLKSNKQGLTFIAESLKMSLEQFLFFYTVSDDFKETVDDTLNQLNPQRVQNGLEKLDVNEYLETLAQSL